MSQHGHAGQLTPTGHQKQERTGNAIPDFISQRIDARSLEWLAFFASVTDGLILPGAMG
jgi:hypothetical protein